MNKKIIIGIAICILLSFFLGKLHKGAEEIRIERDTVVVYVTDTMPILKRDTLLRTSVVRVPVAINDTITEVIHDSVDVEIPISQRVYSDDSTYTAFVSGYEPVLDSISVVQRTITNTITIKEKARRWSIGVQGGVYMTPKGLQPGVGLGVSYRLW